MIKIVSNCCGVVMHNQYNPLRHLDFASQHYLMQVLGGMWSVVFSLTFLSILQFGLTWIAHLLLFASAAIALAVLRESEKQSMVKARATTGFWCCISLYLEAGKSSLTLLFHLAGQSKILAKLSAGYAQELELTAHEFRALIRSAVPGFITEKSQLVLID